MRKRLIAGLILVGIVSTGVLFARRGGTGDPIVIGKRHPYVRGWYYEKYPHAFDCKDDAYSCASCPVGPKDRVIDVGHGHYQDVPPAINAFFACDDINMLVPEKGYEDSDTFLCQREPADGSVIVGGEISGKKYKYKVDCSTGKGQLIEQPESVAHK